MSTTLVVVLAVALLVVGYGDGLAAGIQARLSLPSPWIVLFLGLLALAAGSLAYARRGLPSKDVFQVEVVLWFLGLGLALQLLLNDSVNVAGYIQLALFVVALTLIRAMFARAPDRLLATLGPAVLVAHVFLCGYVLFTAVAWNVTGMDLSVRALIASTPAAINEYYGYRPAAWGAEPAWTAMALAVSYTATYYLRPSARSAAFALTVLAAIALQSGTLFLFLALVVCGVLAQRDTRLVILAGVLFLAALPVFLVGTDRLEAVLRGRDPSLMMRSSSALVAMDVVVRSFPLGVGYGNFRDEAVYGRDFDNFLDLDAASYYKSDVLVLNSAAELGLGGMLVLAYVFRLLGFGRLLLPTILLTLLAVLSGTMLIPALLVLAAVRGSQDRAPSWRRQDSPSEPPGGARLIVPDAIDDRTSGHPQVAPRTG